jgi:hypothetical protein
MTRLPKREEGTMTLNEVTPSLRLWDWAFDTAARAQKTRSSFKQKFYIWSKRNSGNRPLGVGAPGSFFAGNFFGGMSSAIKFLMVCIPFTVQNRSNAIDWPVTGRLIRESASKS